MFKRKTAERIVALGLTVACSFFPMNIVTNAAETEQKIISTSQTADYEDGIINYSGLYDGSLEICQQSNTNNHEVLFSIDSGTNSALWTTGMMSAENELGSMTQMNFRVGTKTTTEWYSYINWVLRRCAWNKYYAIRYNAYDGTLSIVKAIGDANQTEETLPKKDETGNATLTISPKLEPSDTYHDIKMSISGDATTGITISVSIDDTWKLTAYDEAGSYSSGSYGINLINQSVYVDDLTCTCYAAEDWDTNVWSVVDTNPDLLANSAIDLSFMNDSYAGAKGFLKIDSKGNYYFENEPDKPVKFYGTNLNGSYEIEPSHAQTDKIVDRLSKMGYNAVRFSSIDKSVSWGQGIFKTPTSTTVEFDEDKLDSFDYLMYKLKEKGIYVYIDILESMSFDNIPSLSGYGLPSRALAIMLDDGMATWKSMASQLFKHVNPYTGIAYKDDPIFIGVSPWNEGLISNMNLKATDRSKQLFYDDYNNYLTENGKPVVDCGIDEFSFDLWETKGDGYWVSYLADKTMTGYTTMKDYLQKDLDVKAPIGGINMLNDTMVGYMRTASDVHETHSYNGQIDAGSAKTFTYYPHKHTPYSKTFSQELLDNYNKGGVSNQPYSNFIPAHSVGQLYQKPFVLSEFNQQFPSKGRDQLAIISTASGAYNGWDSFIRFDFAGSASEALNNIPYGQSMFGTVSDPLVTATEFQGNLIFRKGNITPAETKFVVVVDESFAKSYNSVWEGAVTPNLAYIPHLFKMETVFADNQEDAFAIYKLTDGLTSEDIAAGNIPKENKIIGYTGERYCNNDKSLKDIATLLINSLDDEELKTTMLSNLDNNLLVTDTGELVFDIANCVYQVNTPYVSALAGTLNGTTFNLGDVSLKADNETGTISVSPLDNNTIKDSNRMLVVYTTDASAAGEEYAPGENENEVSYTRGTLPTLAKIATGEVTLNNLSLPAESYHAYKLDLNGVRVEEIPVTVNGNQITVPLKTDCGYYFEIVSEDNLFTVDGKTIDKFSDLSPKDTVTANVNVSNNTSEEQKVNMFLVLYDGNNRMVDASIEPITLKQNQASCLKPISLQLPDNIDKHYLNLMVWSDYDRGFAPLAEMRQLK